MYLIADSGSTKTDWVEFGPEGIRARFRTAGMNPDIMTVEDMESAVRAGLEEAGYTGPPEEVHYYGASLANKLNVARMRDMLSRILRCEAVTAEHDLLAAARSACHDTPGIACILGTGSNSCLYNGENITREVGGQGYIFGDEGSGSDLGKALLRLALEKLLDPALVKLLEEKMGKSLHEIRRGAYQAEKPNAYLAQFTGFISEHLNEYAQLRDMVKERFRTFLNVTVKRYPEHGHLPVHFVGSIATVFRPHLEEVMQEQGLHTGRFVKSPVDELVQYHARRAGITLK